MISIDEHPQPPDPSSSSSNCQQQQLSYEAFASVSDIDLLKPNTDANLDDTNYQLSNFSIRDYVFGSRSKDIACNWPFSSESLQLCMNSGVKNLLPPFQSLDSLRGSSSVSKCAVDNRLSVEETVGRFDGKLIEYQCDHNEILANTMSNKSTLASSEKMVKNCKFIMKLNSGVRPVEEVTPKNCVIPETTMAAKVCPVCKTFSSSSNTTLNAHIDRCLSEESSMKWTANYPKVRVKHKVKPRKMRLMVDIYKTALHCTIEELDKRNGTSWATDSSFLDQEIDELQAEEEEKKEEPQEPTFVPEIDDHEDREGAVYVDTNGTKVWILSMPKVSNVHDLEAQKLLKGGKGSKLVIKKNKKKAYGKKNQQKLLKLIPNSKKLRKKIADKPATRGQEGDIVVDEGCNKEDRGEKPIAHKQKDDLAITRPPWACSKRTGLAKKRFPALRNLKEGTSLGDTCEDIPSIKLKESKVSSLKKNLKSASREHDAGSKFNLKRKFSAIKKSCENCLSADDDVSGPSQDSSKKSRMEGDTDEKSSFEIENDMGFTSSNGDHSSGGLEITSESAKTDDQVPFQSDGIVGNFMGLRNLNDDFSKLVSQRNNTFDSLDGMDDHIEKEGSYFEEVDPIPIPGPPGSFLPLSPGADDMVSEEELQGNSSLTTMSRVQSSEDQQLHHDVMKLHFISDSTISTVSSPNFARSASARFHDTRLEDTHAMVDAVNKKSVNASDSRSVDVTLTEKGQNPSDYQNDQPCCCARKEGVFSKNIPSYDQESRQGALDSNRRPNSMDDFRSGLFSLTISPPETLKSPADALKLPVYRDFESVGSPTTPILRLMGKNLTVVNTDDDQFGPPPGSTPIRHQQLHNIKNERHNPFFSGNPSQYHINFSHNQNMSFMPQYSNLHPPNNSRSVVDSRPIHALDTMFPGTTNGLTAPVNCPRLDTRNPAKEIIVIDDSSETEADDHIFKEQRMRRSHAPSSSIPLLEKSYSFTNTYNGGVFPVFREIVNDGNHGRWVSTETGSPSPSITRTSSSTSYYPRSFSLPRTQREGGL